MKTKRELKETHLFHWNIIIISVIPEHIGTFIPSWHAGKDYTAV